MSIWDEPADFWIGAGLVAEAPIVLIGWIAPDDFCHAYLSRIIDCPPSIWPICGLGLLSYFSVAWAAHKMGLGRGKN